MNVLSRSFKYIVRILVWGIVSFHISLLVLLKIPPVQERMASWVSSELSKVLKTDVSVGYVGIQLFNRVIVEDVLLEDQEGDDLLRVNRLSARFEFKPLLDGKVVINSVQLLDFAVYLKRSNLDATPNYQFVLDAFASKDTLNKPSNLDLRINSVLINRGKITYDVLSEPKTPGKFNTSHIDIDDFSASMSLKAFRNDSLNAIVKRISLKEQSGICLKKLGFSIIADNKQLKLNDFKVNLSATELMLDGVVITYDSLQHLPYFTEDVTYKGVLNGKVLLSDFSPLLPQLSAFYQPLNLYSEFKGKGKFVECSMLNIHDGKYFSFSADAMADHWNSKQEMNFQGRILECSINDNGLNYIVGNLMEKVPSVLNRLQSVNAKGTVKGNLSNMNLMASVQTASGDLQTNINMQMDENMNRTYSGHVLSHNLNLGKIFNHEKWGIADFNVELKGFNYRDNYPESYIRGIISSLEYSDYCYRNIGLDGIYKDGGFNGKLSLDDDNGRIQIDGAFNVTQRLPEFNLRASVKNLRPNELHLSDKYIDSDISLNLVADFTGNSIDDMNGEILLDSLILNAPEDKGYYLDKLTITAGQVAGIKEVHVKSPFMTALIRGDYSYKTVPMSVIRTVKRYIPSLLTLDDHSVNPRNNFEFDIQLSDADLFKKVFYIPIDVHIPLSLKGYFNDREEELRVVGSFPKLTYNGTLYESGVLICENPLDEFSCLVRGSMLMSSGAMLNLSLDTKAKNDCLRTVLNWGNNTDVTYGGQVAAVTHFSKTESNSSSLQADIELLPTIVVLNDTIWNIHSSHVVLDSGRVYIDNFLFERPGQHLRIDGKVTKNSMDSCIIDLKNIDVQYVLDIVKFDDVEFGGLATGSVCLKNILENLDMNARLHVNNFTVNKGLMGDAEIIGTWDPELPGIRLDAMMEEKNLSSTHVTGYVSPKLKALDLKIQADSTNLALLTPYFDGIFSDLDARANGLVRLYGGFKTLDFDGGVRVKLDAKVDVLNTYLQLHNDSVYISSGEFALKNARLYDREGNSGTVTGTLRHTHLKNLMYHFDIQGNNLLMYDTNDPGDMLFYGKVYGTGKVTLDGGNNALTVDARLTTGYNTTFTYVTGITAEATNNQFITFVDKTPKRIQDDVKTDFYHYTDAQQVEEDEGPPMDFRINMLIDVTPDATMKVIMDPVAGDNITARGNGNFQVSYYNKGDFLMFGNYIIDQGMYKLSMQEIIRKDFILQSGSTVTFTGDPYLANLDVQAVYTVNSVSLSDLSTDASLNQSTVKVNCLMNLTGSLASPTIKFDLELPTVSEEDRELVRSATSTEEQMNTQIIYLLGIGKFYAYDYDENANQSSSATSSLAFSTLSGQLNNMLSQVMENKNWNIGANFSTGQEGWSDVEAEAILSGRLLNNRLIINGNFGYRENVMTNTNFVGDFEAIWLLTKNGDFRLRGYNQTNDRYFTKSTLTTQGIGFIYKKDFNKWSELYQWFIRKRNQSKK